MRLAVVIGVIRPQESFLRRGTLFGADDKRRFAENFAHYLLFPYLGGIFVDKLQDAAHAVAVGNAEIVRTAHPRSAHRYRHRLQTYVRIIRRARTYKSSQSQRRPADLPHV